MRRFELDIGPHTIEKSFKSNTTLETYGLNSHSVTVVATLAFHIFSSHLVANTKMLHACSASSSALNCDASPLANFLLFPCRRLASLFTQFIMAISWRLIVNVCGVKGFWGGWGIKPQEPTVKF
jgi:hypothetical protein